MRLFKHEAGEVMKVYAGQSVLQVLIDSPSWTEIKEGAEAVAEVPKEAEEAEEIQPPKRAAKLKK